MNLPVLPFATLYTMISRPLTAPAVANRFFKTVFSRFLFFPKPAAFLLFALFGAVAAQAQWLQTGSDIDGEAAGDNAGYSVSLSGNGLRIVVGARNNDGAGANAGQARVFAYNGSAWAQLGADLNGAAAGDLFGYAVAISSDGARIAVGGLLNDGGGTDAGHVRVFEYNGSAWVQIGSDILGEAPGDESGRSVALSSDGSTVAIGAIWNDGGGNGSGHVRVYHFNGTSWVQTGGDIDGEAAGDNAGFSVALSADGTKVAVGAYQNDGNGGNSGQARVYQYNGSAWVQLGADIDGESAGDSFGASVSLSSDGTRLAVGADQNDGGGTNAGHVRVFQYTGSAWVQIGADLDGEAAGDEFGYSVSLSSDGTKLAVGARRNDGNGSDAGQVRVFQNYGSAWTQIFADIDGEAAGDETGNSVSLSSDGSKVAMGAQSNGNNGAEAGQARVFGNNGVPAAALNFDDANDGVDLGTSLGNFGTGDFTVETWFKTTVNVYNILLGKRSVCTHSNFWNLVISAGKIYFELDENSAGANYLSLGTPLTYNDNNWHHVACTRSGTAAKIYVDGVLVASGNSAAPTNLNNTTPLSLGSQTCNGYNGSLDEVRIWNTARSCEQINQLRNCELTGSESGLVAYYQFNQGFANENNSGVTTLTDLAGGDHNGTLTGFALTGATSNWVTPGGVVTGTSCPAVVSPEIDVRGGLPLVSILDGDATPSTTDSTDFGNVAVNGSRVRTFTIFNTGNDALTIGSITSSNPKFTIGTLTPAGPITGPSGSATFTVTFLPTATGVQNATITVNSNDCDEAAYDFAVTGTGACPATGSIWYVDAAAASGGNGASWGCAFKNLQDAINAASSGNQIWVAAGTYLPTKDPFGNTSPADSRDKTFYLKNGVKIYGGFNGTETMLSQRDWAANVTTLSGDYNGDDSGLTNNTENAYHVVITVSDANTTQLDGFTVKGGNANGGSGSYISVEGKPIVRGYGGGMHNFAAATLIQNCTFTYNSSTGLGGGMFCNTAAGPQVTNCLFTSNAANNGAGVMNAQSSPTFTSCTFSSNVATTKGGGMTNETSTTVVLTGCVFSGNSCGTTGGGFYIGTSATSATLTNCLLTGNSTGGTGGGLYNSSTAMTLSNCTISGNLASGTCGGLTFLSTNPTVTNCLVWNNRVGSTTGSATANLYTSGSTPVITYSLIQNNNPSGAGNLDGITNAANANYPSFATPLDPATAPSTAGNFHIGCGPAVNSGTATGAPVTDVEGNARPFSGGFDLGAYERQVATPEIDVQGNSVSIVDGDITPDAGDYTDFGNVAVNGSLVRTFTIFNTGNADLTVGSITSSDPAFSIGALTPASPVTGPSGSASFTVTFSPTATGVQNATITINNNDCDEAVYDFAVTGKGATPAAALNFDGMDDYISTSNNTTLDLSIQTVEFWVKPVGSGDNDLLVGKRNYNGLSSNDTRWSIHFQNGNQGLYFYSPAGTAVWTYAFTPNQWYHIAMVTDATSTKLYIDGTFISSKATTINSPTNLPLIFGASAPNFEVFPGNLDEVRIWNTARSCEQINQLRNCELTGSESGLVAYYKFNQGFAGENNGGVTTLTDATSGNLNGTLTNFTLNGATSNWGTPGGVTTGTSCPAVTVPEIDVQGGSPLVSIADGDNTPSTADGTDFGNVLVNGSLQRSFTIQNTGTANLTVSSIASNNGRFTVGALTPAGPIVGGGSATFTVTFNPLAAGTQNATITINNDDCDEAVYDFAVTGTGALPGAALNLDGTNDYVDVNYNLNQSSLTLEAWVKPTSNARMYVICNDNDGNYGAGFGVNNYQLEIDCHNTFINVPGTLFSNGTWAHVAVVYQSDARVRAYVNGTEVYNAIPNASWTASMNGLTSFSLGRHNPFNTLYYNGSIDEVRVWSRSLCQPEIQAQRTCELTGSESGLAVYFKFNQGIANNGNAGLTTLNDLAGTAQNGTLTNFALSGSTSNWTEPGGVASGTSCTPYQEPEINVQGGSPLATIVDGDNTPSTADSTDFGLVAVNGSRARNFTIFNTGNAALTISSITSSNAKFVVSGAPTSVTAGSSASFTVTFTPTATGTQTATITINNNDCDEAVYDFAVTGKGATPAAALSFDGTNDYVSLPGTFGGPTWTELTIEAWVKVAATSGDFEAIVSATDLAFAHLQLFSAGSNVAFTNTGGVLLPIIPQTPTGQWRHVAMVIKSGDSRLYVDGVQQGPAVTTTFGNITASSSVSIGRGASGSRYLNGQLDEVRIWNTARTCDQINQLRNCELTGSESGLVAYYKFNQGFANENNSGATTLTDAAGGDNNGTLSNFTLDGTSSNWVTPGGVTTGTSCPAVTAPEANVRGNSTDIADGDNTPSTADHTDFNGAFSRTFTIQNTMGTATLNISGITSSNAKFVISGAPSTVGAGASATFTVTYNPTDATAQTATITINSNDCDEAVYDFAVTATATPAKALNFDGVDDYVSFPTTGMTASSGTLSFWMNAAATQPSNASVLVEMGNENPAIFLWDNGSTLYFRAGGTFGSQTSVPFTGGTWKHVAMTWAGAGQAVVCYIDGVQVATFTQSGNVSFASTAYLGRSSLYANGTTNFLGNMDDIRLWNRALCANEIVQLMNCEVSAASDNLQAYFKCDQGFASAPNTGITALTDDATAIGGANNGTFFNFALSGSTSNFVAPGGVTGGACSPTFPEINVQGGSPLATIADGDNTPSTTEGTDFGLVAVNGSLVRTFTLFNTGNAALTVTSITSDNAKFVVSGAPTSVTAGSSASFTVTFTPTATGTQTATITINNNDCDQAVYDFAVTGKGADPGAALHFDGVTTGTGDFVSLGTSSFNNIGAITISAWIKPEPRGATGYQEIWSKELVNSFSINNATGKLHVNFANGSIFGTATESTTTIPTNGTWTHVAATRSASGVVKVYINGVLESTANNALTGATTYNRAIGAKPGVVPLDAQMYKGAIDELRIWNRDLCPDEVQQFMNCELNPAGQVGLSAVYRFNQGFANENNSGVTTLTDATGNGNTGTLTNFALTGSTSNWVTPGGVTTGTNCPALTTPEANVQGGSPLVTIVDGDNSPSTADSTDFGLVAVNGNLVRNFTIFNTGNAALTVNSITSDNAKFVVSGAPTSVAAGSSASFTVTFTPTATGTQTATITINNSDCDEAVYDFVVTGKGATPASALDLSGSNDYVSLSGTSTLLDGATQFTIEHWIKSNGTGGIGIVGKGTSGCCTNTIHTGLDVNGVFFLKVGNQDGLITGSGVVPTGTWIHLAAVYNGNAATPSDRIKIYANGVLQSASMFGSIPATAPAPNVPFVIGAALSDGAFNYNGQIDEVRIWNTARSCDQINQLRNCELTGSEPGLVAYYKFNQGFANENNSGVTTLTDAAGGDNNGTLSNFTLTGTSSNWVTPGGVTTGTSCLAVAAPEANVQGGSPLTTIVDGDNTPSTVDSTDFGNVAVNGSLARNFTIFNTGNAALTVSSITSDNAKFVVSGAPTSVTAGSSASFTVTFTPTATGTQTATITINNNDCDEAVYDFVVTGKGATPASALHFDGGNDNVSIPNNAALQLDQFTLETWFNPSTAANFPVNPPAFIAKGASGFPDYFLVPNSGGSRKVAGGFYTGSTFVVVASTTDLAQNTWYHLAVTFDGTALKIYVNGNLENTVAAAGLHPRVTANALSLGLTNGTQYVNGALDEVRIWNLARSCEEIRQLRNCELAGSENGLVAYYKFNQGLANENNGGVTTLIDAATTLGGANDGTLNGFTLDGATSNWITPGGVTTGTSCPVSITYPEVNLRGNGTDIADGDNTPSTTDGTDFNGTSSRTFTIQNTGTAALTISSITSSNTKFVVSGAPGTVLASSSATFTVTYNPTDATAQTATITVNNDDCDEAAYDFVVTATATPAKALHFDGVDDEVIGTSPTAFWGTTPTTLEFWLKKAPGADMFVGDLGFTYQVRITNGALNLSGFFLGNFATANNLIADNTWTHCAITYDGLQTNASYKAYINGSPVAFTGSYGSHPPTSGQLRMGVANNNYHFTGSLDEVRAWKEERTAAQILANYNTEIAGMSPCLDIYWKFNQGFIGANNSTVTAATDAANAVVTNGTLSNFTLNGASSNWVAGSGITETASAYIPAPEADLLGHNNTALADGTSSTSVAQGTNLGNVNLGSSSAAKTFTLQNNGTAALNVSGIASSNAQFAVTALTPASPIPVGMSATFTLTFTPTATGAQNATITINNDDCDEAAYNFAVTGTGVCVPPSFTTCPAAPVTANTVTGTCAAPVSYTVTEAGNPAPTLTYAFTGATTGSGSGTGTGSTFNKGNTTVTVTATSSCSPPATCSFTVTVTDNEKPQITCTGPVTINTTAELCTGTTTLPAPTATDNCSGVFGNALNFDGTNDYISAGNVTQLSGTTKLTLESWIYPTNGSTGMVMGKGTTTSANAINIERNGQTLYFRVCGAGDSYGFVNNVLPTNTWTHIACVYDGTLTGNANRLKIYINGVLQTLSFAGASIPASAPSSTAPLTVGAFDSSTIPLGASLNEVRIWNTARTQAEIQANMNSEISAQSGLVVLYHFNQGVAYANNAAVTTATDDSGNSYTGTLNNFVLNGAASNWIAFSPTLSNNAPATFPKGTTTVVWTARDDSGNTQTCQQTVTVIDNQAPTLTSPGNQALNTIATTCAANYTIADPVSDNCTGSTWGYTLSGATEATVTGIADGMGSGALSFSKGVTTVVLSATDGANNATTVSFTVTVTDNEKPTISGCATNQSINVIAGTCAADYAIPAPMLSDNCAGPLTWNATFSGNAMNPTNLTGLANGAASSSISFNKGATTVTLTATDVANNTSTATCSFVVTVVDNEKPQITCAGPVTVNTTAGLCTGTATLPAPTVTDNCPFGGNGLNFDGNNDQVVSADYSGTALTGDLTLECWFKGSSLNGRTLFGRGFQQEFDLTLWNNQLDYYHGNGSTWVDLIFSYTFSSNTWYHVAVVRNASAQTVSLYVNGVFQQTLTYGTPLPVAQTAAFRIGNRAAGTFFLGSIDEVRVWTVARTPAQIAANWNQELAAQPGLFALYHLNEGSANGNNSGVTTAADASGNAKNGTLANFALSGTSSNWGIGAFGGVTNNAPATYPKGNTTVTWTATDASGNTQTCQQTVTVTDNEAPALANPGNESLNTIAATCAANYTIADPVSDNCTGSTWGYTLSGATEATVTGIADGMGSGELSFNKGVTTVVLSATDGTNNATTVSFTVTVTDNQAPTLANPGNQAFNVIAGTCAANYTIADPVSDNCPGATWGYTLSGATAATVTGIADGMGSGELSFNKGVTTVVLSATDGTNSATTVSFTVTVTDNQAPTITCPVNQTVPPTNPNPCSAVVNGINGNYNDNCGGSSLAYVLSGATTGSGSGQASGHTFLLGTTSVTYTVTDGANLTSSCLFTVTVTNCNITFSGTIRWEHDGTSGVANATVNLTGAGTGSGTTASNGDYLVSIPYTTGNFTLKPVKNVNRLNGVTTADVTAIQQHLTNINPITNPYKLVAADINRSNSISSADANTLNQCLLGNPAANAIFNVYWRFMPQSHTLALPPWGFPEQIDLTGVTGNQSGKDFKGVKIGDVVSTWANPANFGAGEPLVFRVPDEVLQAGSEVTADFRADELDDLTSFQFALHFDPEQLELAAIEPLGGVPLSADNFGVYNLAEGEIRVAWAQESRLLLSEAAPVFRLRFKALQGGARLSELLRLEEDALPGRVYNSVYAESGVELRYTAATGTGGLDNREGLSLRNRPNPFAEVTTLRFNLPEAGEAELRISDAAGRLLFSKKAMYTAGRHEETLRLEGGSGVLFAELVTERGSVARRMLAVKN